MAKQTRIAEKYIYRQQSLAQKREHMQHTFTRQKKNVQNTPAAAGKFIKCKSWADACRFNKR